MTEVIKINKILPKGRNNNEIKFNYFLIRFAQPKITLFNF